MSNPLKRIAHAGLISLMAVSLAACGAGETVEELSPDGMNDIGLSAGKADGPFSECDLAQALVFVNAPNTNFDALKAAGVHSRAAENIIAVKAGPDETLGTADDEFFETAEELDAVFFVGPAAFRQLVAHVADNCVQTAAAASVIFSPQPKESSHLAAVVGAIDDAQTSVDIAMYSFSDSAISDALERAVNRGLTVRFVFETARDDKNSPENTKSSRLEDIGVDVRYINKIMHHKFAIIDGPTQRLDQASTGTLITGSANWSNSAATKYDENTIILQGNAEALLRFQQQFNLMWNYSRDFAWNELLTWFSTITIKDTDLPDDDAFDAVFTSDNFQIKQTNNGPTFSTVSGSNHVSDTLVALIMGAQSSIHVASGHLRSRPVSEAIIRKRQQDPHVDIRVYLDGQEYISSWYHKEQGTKLEECVVKAGSSKSKQQSCMDKGFLFGHALHLAGVDVRYKYYAYRWHYSYAPQMHNKFLIIDQELLASGSYNLSDNAEHQTLENVAIYRASGFPDIVAAFEARFETLWTTGQADGLFASLIAEIEGATDEFPIVFDAMSLDWNEVTQLKKAIKTHCPTINSDDFRKNPQAHFVCKL